jgi:hypothetical protein
MKYGRWNKERQKAQGERLCWYLRLTDYIHHAYYISIDSLLYTNWLRAHRTELSWVWCGCITLEGWKTLDIQKCLWTIDPSTDVMTLKEAATPIYEYFWGRKRPAIALISWPGEKEAKGEERSVLARYLWHQRLITVPHRWAMKLYGREEIKHFQPWR